MIGQHSTQYKVGKSHPRYVDDKTLIQRIALCELGTLELTGSEIIRGKHRQIEMRCNSCEKVRLINCDNILSGKTTSCRCRRAVKNRSTKGSIYANELAVKLGERYDAILQRCNNPKDMNYSNYGARGIEVKFESRDTFITWFITNFNVDTLVGLQIDRIDNNGHYEPGNLRLVSAKKNQRNKRNSVKLDYKGILINASDLWHFLKLDYPEFSLSLSRTAKLGAAQVPWQEILKIRSRAKRTTTGPTEPDRKITGMYTRYRKRTVPLLEI